MTARARGSCSDCPLAAEVTRLGAKLMVVERDIVNTSADLREITARLESFVGQLGEQVGRMTALIQPKEGGK